ncbi:MAG: hypothetical protein OFPII_05800 [Osedax symbiont Rs1]|nr:MAG: hypothetical protein OFPII_05800 [Osedax symbiont Rs1]
MNITWTSRQGQSRRANSDAVAIGYKGQYLVAVVVDAAEKQTKSRLIVGTNEKGQRLAQYWADSCLCELISTSAYLDEANLVSFLHEKQKHLRVHYLHDIAAYGVLVLDTNTTKFDWWFSGDCRLGLKFDKGETEGKGEDNCQVDWLSTPHRLENSPLFNTQDKTPAKAEEYQQIAKHTLSQSLNARRFMRPEKISSQLLAKQSIVIATDGYWCEHLAQGVAIDSLEDDASLLTIRTGKRQLSLTTDTSNLLVMYR